MITISKPKPENAEEINGIIKTSWYDTYINEQAGITKKDIDLMYKENEERQIETIKNRALNQRDDDISLIFLGLVPRCSASHATMLNNG